MRKRQYRRKRSTLRRPRKAKVSVPLKKAIKQVMAKQVETKELNVPMAGSTSTNTVALSYTSGAGLVYLVSDLFSMPQGTSDTTSIYGANRIGDRVSALGFQMDYYISMKNTYAIGSNTYFLPYVKVRVIAFTAPYGVPPPAISLVYDSNYVTASTTTLQPVDKDTGYVKNVLYDRSFIIRNHNNTIIPSGVQNLPLANCIHFKKYVPYKRLIKYVDNAPASAFKTDLPIYVAISAEYDDANTLTPTGTGLLNITGFSRAWFKDA